MNIEELEVFLSKVRASDHHIQSYNTLVTHELPQMIKSFLVDLAVSSKEGGETRESGGKCTYRISFDNVHIPPACILRNGSFEMDTPLKCRKEKTCYMTPIIASVVQQKIEDEIVVSTKLINRCVIAHLPVMLGSSICSTRCDKFVKNQECSMDTGGYFIINGIERVLVTQQRKSYNTSLVLEDKATNSYISSMRSISEETGHSVVVELISSKSKPISKGLSCSLPYLNKKIPIVILLIAFGIKSPEILFELLKISNLNLLREFQAMYRATNLDNEDALNFIGKYASKSYSKADSTEGRADDLDEGGLEESVFEEVGDPEEADAEELGDDGAEAIVGADLDCEDDFDGSDSEEEQSNDEIKETLEEVSARKFEKAERDRRISYARQIITTELFPHLGIYAPAETKRIVLINMLRKLILTKLKVLIPSERDNLCYKRFENSGILFLELYSLLFKNFFNSMKDSYGKSGNILDMISKMDLFVTKNIRFCLATGKWGMQRSSYVKQGVSQVLSRLSYLGTQSHLQRVVVPIGKEGKHAKVRLIHPSQYGYLCLFETPEGQTCGTVLNMTVSCSITSQHPSPKIRDTFFKFCSEFIVKEDSDYVSGEVWINNTYCYHCKRPTDLIDKLRCLRAQGIFPKDVSFSSNLFSGYQEIYIFSDKGRITRPLFCAKTRAITFVDTVESQSCAVATFEEELKGDDVYDYCELHPMLLYGICSGCIPFSDHNQSPRNIYEASMLKQAIGFFSSNYPIRYDSSSEVLDYPQKCLVSTAMGRQFGMHDMPAGVNCIVAISTCWGWNAEDGVVLNKSAVERGLFVSTSYKTTTVEEYKSKSNTVKKFCVPNVSIQKSTFNYSLLDETGIVRKGSFVKKRDVIVGRVQEIDHKGKIVKKDCSELSEEEGIVEDVELFRSRNEYKMVIITFKVRKIPERGDKFANLSAQKGTCGMMMSSEDMPFTSEGIIPDLMINPNALPSRMTISMFLEMVMGKESCLSGKNADATPFSVSNEDLESKLGKVLAKNGFERNGWEQMICGTTGKPFQAQIFMGTSYYQKLKHMVSDKMHARAFGNVTSLTRQPLAGRSKEGGLRLGEMERDNLLGHGDAQFLMERMFDMSDKYSILLCNRCGVTSNRKSECHLCGNSQLYETNMPYAAKLLFQLLTSCLIGSSMRAKPI